MQAHIRHTSPAYLKGLTAPTVSEIYYCEGTGTNMSQLKKKNGIDKLEGKKMNARSKALVAGCKATLGTACFADSITMSIPKSPCLWMLADWMGGLPEDLHRLPISSLAIPGSHDSFAYYLDVSGPLAPGADWLEDVCEIFGPLCKGITYNWSVTQALTFTEQLIGGVRYFDLRVASKPDTEDLYYVHGLYGERVEDTLWAFWEFLEDHPKEIILLDFQHFYNVSEDQHCQFLSMLCEIFGLKLCPRQDIKNVTLDMMWQHGFQVIVLYSSSVIEPYPQFWYRSSITNPWANTSNPDTMVEFLENNYQDGRPEDKFYVSQGVLTPDALTIIGNPTSSLRDVLAVQAAPAFNGWVVDKDPGGINICILDFVEMDEFIPKVIALNAKFKLNNITSPTE